MSRKSGGILRPIANRNCGSLLPGANRDMHPSFSGFAHGTVWFPISFLKPGDFLRGFPANSRIESVAGKIRDARHQPIFTHRHLFAELHDDQDNDTALFSSHAGVDRRDAKEIK